MKRWNSRHRLALLLCFFFFAPNGSADSRSPSLAEDSPTETSAQLPPREELPPLATSTPEQTKTEQYTLSHVRYEKAVAYSRAGYTLDFLCYILAAILLFLLLLVGTSP